MGVQDQVLACAVLMSLAFDQSLLALLTSMFIA